MNLAAAPDKLSDDRFSPLTSSLVIATAFVLLTLATILFFAAESTLTILAVVGVDGVVAALWVLACAGFGTWLAAACFREIHWALRLATSIGLGIGAVALLLLGLGLLGWLNRPVTWVIFFIGLIAGGWRIIPPLLRNGLPIRPPPSPRETAAGWLWLPLAISLGMMCVAASITPGLLWKPMDPHPYDVLSYHLQVPREWYELGRIVPLYHNVFSYFPMGMEVHYLAAMHLMGGVWKAMYVAQFINVTLAVAMVIGVYGSIRTLRPDAGKLPAIAAAALAGGVPWVLMLASVTYAETGLMLLALLTVTWLLIHLRTRALPPAILAGALGGLACGVKYPAVPMLVIAAAVATVVAGSFDGVAKLKKTIAAVILYCAVALLTFSPWLIRNLAWSGNPVFPLAMKTLGTGHFTDQQVERFNTAHAIPPAQADLGPRLQRLIEVFIWDWQFGYILIPLTLLSIALSIRQRESLMLLLLMLTALLVWFFFTHLIGRFLVFLIPSAAVVIGLSRYRVIANILAPCAAVIVAVVGWVSLYTPLAQAAEFGKMGLFAAEDLSFMIPPELEAEKSSDRRIALVGDAAAFDFQFPMNRLRYRTVFDVKAPANDIFDAWGTAPSDVRVIHAPELRRLHQTYAHIPQLRPAVDQSDRIVVVGPKQN